jgi:hypothetical protein
MHDAGQVPLSNIIYTRNGQAAIAQNPVIEDFWATWIMSSEA